MAGAKDGVFAEKISPYLRQKMAERGSSAELSFLDLQYVADPSENVSRAHEVARHYESELHPTFEGEELRGVEKLYRRTLLVEPPPSVPPTAAGASADSTTPRLWATTI